MLWVGGKSDREFYVMCSTVHVCHLFIILRIVTLRGFLNQIVQTNEFSRDGNYELCIGLANMEKIVCAGGIGFLL